MYTVRRNFPRVFQPLLLTTFLKEYLVPHYIYSECNDDFLLILLPSQPKATALEKLLSISQKFGSHLHTYLLLLGGMNAVYHFVWSIRSCPEYGTYLYFDDEWKFDPTLKVKCS